MARGAWAIKNLHPPVDGIRTSPKGKGRHLPGLPLNDLGTPSYRSTTETSAFSCCAASRIPSIKPWLFLPPPLPIEGSSGSIDRARIPKACLGLPRLANGSLGWATTGRLRLDGRFQIPVPRGGLRDFGENDQKCVGSGFPPWRVQGEGKLRSRIRRFSLGPAGC